MLGRSGRGNDEAIRFCREILPAVSRTFALSIRLLPGTLGDAVCIAYLVCRIADTIEDAPGVAAPRKAELLDRLMLALDVPAVGAALPSETGDVTGDDAHLRLVRHSDLVLRSYHALPEGSRAPVRRWAGEMIAGMRKFVLAYPEGIRIQSVEEYREYCYYVAGTVGYLLTDLWREHAPSIGAERYDQLRARSRAFAEALQTVNILKDVARDAEHENSIYVPEELLRGAGSSHAALLRAERVEETRAALASLVRLARTDLDVARDYLLLIPRRAVPIRLFCALPLLFAYATLRDLTRTPQALASRVNVKISRAEVKSLTVLGCLTVMSNRALAWLAAKASRTQVIVGGM